MSRLPVAGVLPAALIVAAAACGTTDLQADVVATDSVTSDLVLADVPDAMPGDVLDAIPADVPDLPDPGYGYVPDVPAIDLSGQFLPPPPAGKEWSLVLADEFDGTAINTDLWEISQGKGRTNVYDPRAVVLDGSGILHMKVFQEDGTYYTGGLSTQGRWHKAKGYLEARVQFQKQGGHWSAFWMYSETICSMENGGRDGAELDVFERPWTLDPFTDFTQRTVHWDCHQGKRENPQEIPGVSQGFHTFGMWWSDDAYIFYTDGKETWRSTDGGICEVPLYMLLTDEIEDNRWFGAGLIGDAVLPDEWLVDYVRVFDLVDSPASPSGSAR